jgi:periplasmic protein TonB
MRRSYQSIIPFGMLLLLLLVAGSAAALEPKPSVNEKAAVAPQQKDSPKVKSAPSAWQREVFRLIALKRRYPFTSALLSEWGTVVVAFRVDRQGRIARTGVTRSSGSTTLDNAALELVRQAQPFPPPPPGEKLDLTITITYDPALACGPGDKYLFAREYCASRTQSQKPQ